MSIVCQKFRLHMIGHYNWSYHIIMHNMHKTVGPNLFVCNENQAYIMPHVTAHAVMSCTHCTVHVCRQARHPMYMWQPADLYLS